MFFLCFLNPNKTIKKRVFFDLENKFVFLFPTVGNTTLLAINFGTNSGRGHQTNKGIQISKRVSGVDVDAANMAE